MSSVDKKCSICQKPLGDGKRPEVTLSCKHKFHHQCAKQRLNNENSKDCPIPICRKKFALEDALKGGSSDHGAPASKGKSPASDFHGKDSSDDEWECSNCDKKNSTSFDRCKSCNQSKYGPSSAIKSVALAAGKSYDQMSNVANKYDDDDSPPINRQRWNGPDTTPEWECDECEYVNRGSDAICKNCRQGKQSAGKIEAVSRKSNRSPSPDHYSAAASYSSSKHGSSAYSKHDDDSYSSSKHGTSTYSKHDDDSYSSSKHGSSAYSKHDDDDSYSSSQSDYAYHPGSKASPKPKDYTHASDVKPKPPKEKPRPPTPQDPVPVYISDLPLGINDDQQLAKHIRNRVKNSLFIELSDITCYSKLGVGVMYVADNQTKKRLTEEIGVLAYDPKGEKTTISFVETLNLVSYIVLDISKEKIDSGLPTADEISRRWADLNNGQQPRACEQLNIQFPNIYRLVSTSLDKIINSLDHEVFKIKNLFAQIYFCADCSFFEEVPRSITENQLQEAVVNAIKEPHISTSALHIQLNKKTNTACIIAANAARKWATIAHLSINDKTLSKKDKLACRLVIYPIPKGVSLQSITQHADFNGHATVFKMNEESLILDIMDKNIFDGCIKRGALRIGGNKLSMEVFTNNRGGDEINCDTWYEGEMVENTKPDIMRYVAERDHSIFRWKWNAKIWIEQFQNATPEKFGGDFPKDPREQRGTPIDLLRHQLQMTVMLNTLGSIHYKRYFIRDREIKLNLNHDMKTIVYNHESRLKKSDKMPTKTPYPKTKISVVGDDCVVAYEKLLRNGKKPLLLNMASATSPGGGFRKGDGAQEENLFRRSDYFRSLDVGMDDFLPKRSERVCCTSEGRLEPLRVPHKMYPIEEYGAIYTSGLTFFRHSQDAGYEYLEKPIENVCAIAAAAYRDPKLEGRLLSSKYAVGTRKKLENIFAIAHHHGHDSIVLSAFGCGAFRNPPIHIAKLFYSVIEQYAGFFETIVFAIIDDHNAGQRLNPEGNYKPFVDVLDGKTVTPLTPMNKPDTMFGPYRVSSDGSKFHDVNIFDLDPCYYAAKCIEINKSEHTRQYSHPPFCAEAMIKGKCDLTDNFVHMTSFIHRKPCPYGGKCRDIDEKKHSQELEHPSYCSEKASCQNMDEVHLKQFRHLPICDKGTNCMQYQKRIQTHCESCRHFQRRCPYGNACIKFHDKNHIKEEQHPFPSPCPRTPFHCSAYATLSEAAVAGTVPDEIQKHCLECAHVCRFGRNCGNNTTLHHEKSIHIARRLCPYDGKCNKLNQEEHLNSFTHTNVADIRRVCDKAGKCPERRKIDHILKFRHARSHGDSGIVQYYGLNSGIDFVQNLCEIMTRIDSYVQNQKWKPLPFGTVPREILDWFRTVRPVHRCNPVIFESILLHGHVMSRDHMENLKKPKFVATSVMQHSRIRRIDSLYIPQYAQHTKEYILAIVTAEFQMADFPPPEPDPALGGGPAPPPVPKPPRPLSASLTNLIKEKENILSGAISSADLNVVKKQAIEIAQASIKLHTNPAGIGHAPDKALGTHKRVFSILGPHLGHYYGDIFIVFKRDILHHPDADYSMLAATTFGKSGNAYIWRPWLGPDPGDLAKRISQYHNSKLHASIPGHEYAIAMELLAITSLERKLNSMDIDLKTIIERWLHIDSHRTIEAHLPQLIPLDYIDYIYMPKNIFDSLNAQTRRSIDANFKHSIDITSHNCPFDNVMGPAGPTPAVKERAEYQKYVIDDLLKRFKHDAHNPPAIPIEGAIITVPTSTFTESFPVPLTISQAHELYRFQHKQNPPDDIAYIYWQAINGDMMIALSNEPIGSNEDKQPNLRCLLCYIAPKSGLYGSNYHEQTTYLNCGSPFKHHAFVNSGQYKAHSNIFHIGSNTDDFITYCLEIHRSTGKVILRLAGSNAIYNHEEIFYEFKHKKELDVTKLEYIQVSANIKIVTVRNLIVCFEKQEDLHPTFDASFKKTTAPTASSGGGHSHSGSSLKPCPNNVNCLIQYVSDASGTEHNEKFSHPCRYSEICQKKESYLTHEPHSCSPCPHKEKCNKLTDPYHRAEYRHKDLPDFLVPCHDQKKCSIKSTDHLIKYSHGEEVFKKTTASSGGGHSHSDSSLKPCPDNVNCLIQYASGASGTEHNEKFSHPCRYSEICQKKESYLTHEPHSCSPCPHKEKCNKLTDPYHRAEYRHKDLPDFLVPCRDQKKCSIKSTDHLIKYSHGEEVFKKKAAAASPSSDDHRTPCKDGSECKQIGDGSHRAKYSHQK